MKYDVLVNETVVATAYTALDQVALRDFYLKQMRDQGFTMYHPSARPHGCRVWGRAGTR